MTTACYIPVALGSYVSFSAQNEAHRRRFTLTWFPNSSTSLCRPKSLNHCYTYYILSWSKEQSHSNYHITPAMRLINIKTYQLESFDNWETVPPYAILSHTWEQEEVLFRDITTDVTRKKQGWGKIVGASVEAEKLGIFYLWVDTCCIDKESSAELSMSINSMFAW